MPPFSLRSPSGSEIVRVRLLKCVKAKVAALTNSNEAQAPNELSAELLAQALGLDTENAKLQPQAQLSWPGKYQSLLKALAPCTKSMVPRPELSWGKSASSAALSDNLYVEGDNLEALKLLGLSYNGAVKAIYIDPPYNTGKDFVYADNFAQSRAEYEVSSGVRAPQTDSDWQESLSQEAGLRLRSNKETDGRYHSNWCSLIYPRLLLARQMLRQDGVIFISIDDYEQHNLKVICDEVFGSTNFVMQLVWERAYSPKNDAKFVSTSHDYILMYAYDRAAFAAALKEQGLSFDPSSNELLRYEVVGHSQEGTKELKALLQDGVFDGPKPVRLIKHLLKLSGLKAQGHELVLDFFSGSATTAQAVLELNAEDDGNRRFIMVQLPEACSEEKSNSAFATICDIGRARIRAVVEQIAKKLELAVPAMGTAQLMHQNSAGGGGEVLVA